MTIRCFFLKTQVSGHQLVIHACSVYHSKKGVWTTKESSFSFGGRNMKFDMPMFHKGGHHFISKIARRTHARILLCIEPIICFLGTNFSLKKKNENVCFFVQKIL